MEVFDMKALVNSIAEKVFSEYTSREKSLSLMYEALAKYKIHPLLKKGEEENLIFEKEVRLICKDKSSRFYDKVLIFKS